MTRMTMARGGSHRWIRLRASDSEGMSDISRRYGISLNRPFGRAVVEEAGFLLIPVEQVSRDGGKYRETAFLAAFSPMILITVERERTAILDELEGELRKEEPKNAADLFFLFLMTLNDGARQTIRQISARLDAYTQEVARASGGFDTAGRQAGVADIARTAVSLGEAEELAAKMVEGELQLARAARWLRRDMEETAMKERIDILLSDMSSLRRFAHYQHDKIRSLEESMMTTLDIKQNQITKVFTVITAVFTPPTLVSAFYGQNFSYMPELALPYAEWIVILMTAVAALAPMFYIKYKGWMR